MLAYRSTPIKAGVVSPAELLNNRKLAGIFLVREYLKPHGITSREQMIKDKDKQAEVYNRTARELKELQQYQEVMVQLDPDENKWDKAVVVETLDEKKPRRYVVQTENGGCYQQNRRFLRPSYSVEQKEDHKVKSEDHKVEDQKTEPRWSARTRQQPKRLISEM